MSLPLVYLPIAALDEIRIKFDEEVHGARSAKFAASTTAVAGSILSIVGFGLSFVTFGASAVVGYVGTGISGIDKVCPVQPKLGS